MLGPPTPAPNNNSPPHSWGRIHPAQPTQSAWTFAKLPTNSSTEQQFATAPVGQDSSCSADAVGLDICKAAHHLQYPTPIRHRTSGSGFILRVGFIRLSRRSRPGHLQSCPPTPAPNNNSPPH